MPMQGMLPFGGFKAGDNQGLKLAITFHVGKIQ